MLRRWWTKKYSLPWTPSNIGSFTVLDLLVEFYEDLYDNNKEALYEASRNEDGEIVFESTGDPLIDKWEQELAMGIDPDLTEGLSLTTKAQLDSEKQKYAKAKSLAPEVFGIDESFSSIPSIIKDSVLGGKGR